MRWLGKQNFMGNEVKNLAIAPDDTGIEFEGPGRLVRRAGRLLFGVAFLDGEDTSIAWVPLLQEKNTYIHEQQEPSAIWTIPHDMNSTRLIVQPWPDGEVAVADKIEAIDNDTVQITFSMPVSGTASIMVGNFDGLAKADIRYELPFVNENVVTVNHGLGYNPIIRVLNGANLELLNYTLTNPTVNQSVITFSDNKSFSGTVYCL